MKMSQEELDNCWLLDRSLIKRSFAVAGYYFLAMLMIYGVIFAFAVVMLGVAAVFE